MQIPESVQKITSETPSSALIEKQQLPPLVLDEVVLLIKKSLTLSSLASFEKGLVFYKTNNNNDKQIIKNFISLFSECFSSSLKANFEITEHQQEIITATKTFFDSFNLNFEAFYNNLFILNKQKNILDVNDISLIILGYAITLIKKIHNSRN